MCHSDRVCVVTLLVISGLGLCPAARAGQNQNHSATRLPECKEADLEIHFEAYRSANSTFSLVTTGQNISGHSCSFDSQIFDPTLNLTNPDDWEKAAPNRIAYPDCCKYGLIEEKESGTWNSVVNPGDTVRETFRWSAKPPKPGIACLNADWLSTRSWLLTAPSLLKNVCSDITVVSIEVASAPDEVNLARPPQDAPLILTTSKTTYDEEEFFSLRLSRNRTEQRPTPVDAGCPTFFVWHRSDAGDTRTDEVQPYSFKGCPGEWPGSRDLDWDSGINVDSGAVSRWGGVGNHELQVFELTGPLPDGHYRLIPSNIVHIKTIDPASMARKWSRTKGVGADIALDKDTYQLGEDIPLHMAIENFDADVPVYGPNPIMDECWSVGLKVLDSAGKEVSPQDRFEDFWGCNGHGFPPTAFEKGKLYPLEWHLESMGWLPKRTGTYTIVLSWCTSTGSVENNDHGWKTNLSPYAIAEATATIRIVGNARPTAR